MNTTIPPTAPATATATAATAMTATSRRRSLCRSVDAEPIDIVLAGAPAIAEAAAEAPPPTPTTGGAAAGAAVPDPTPVPVSTVREFEDVLEAALRTDVPVAVMYAPRSEALLLKCQRRPHQRRPQYDTITGLLEEQSGGGAEDDEDVVLEGGEDPPPMPLTLNAWMRASFSSSASSSSSSAERSPKEAKHAGKPCPCPVPHSDWIRSSTTATTPATAPAPEASISSANDNDQRSPRAVIDWVDLRRSPASASDESSVDESSGALFPTPAAACHFLRSLLPPNAHCNSSPWPASAATNTPTNTSACDRDDTAPAPAPADSCTILCLPGDEPPSALMDFRVADAAPSWYLFSICLVNNNLPLPPPPPGAAPFSPLNSNVDHNHHDQKSNATLLVYRRLPPRPHLSTIHPATGESVPTPGCLWETIIAPINAEEQEAAGGGKEAENEQLEEEQEGGATMMTRLVGPPYVDAHREYPGLLEPLLQHVDAIRAESQTISHWTAWPEQQHYSSVGRDGAVINDAWTVFPLCFCFPAHDLSKRTWVPACCQQLPQTVALLKRHLGDTLRTALLSRLRAGCVLQAHTGWHDLANTVFRVHVPLVVPDGDCCGTWVDGCVELHRAGQPLAFDDSKTHWAFNYSAGDRIVLILDLVRPASLPVGTATGGHSDELDGLIAQMMQPS